MFRYVIITMLSLLSCFVRAQEQPPPKLLSLRWADTPNRPRLKAAMIGTVVAYPTAMIGLWQAWYANYPLQKFHFFDDNGEWNQMDKMGHFFSTYQETRLGYHLGRWSGLSNKRAVWTGIGLGLVVQTSFEIMDGFSEQWGFSLGDIGFNALGAGLFAVQQMTWKEQRITIKMSAMPVRFPTTLIQPFSGTGPPITLQQRSDQLYGTGPVNLFLKNYNTLLVWLSANPRSFMADGNTWFPPWLNIAVGMGGDNMFAGFGYAWQDDKTCTGSDCLRYRVDPALFPRSRQLLLSLDIDLTRIPVRNRVLRTVLSTINIIKIPSPTVEWNQRRGLKFHPIYF